MVYQQQIAKHFDFYRNILPSVFAVAGSVPLFHALLFRPDFENVFFGVLNLIGWSLAALLVVVWREIDDRVRQSGAKLNIEFGSTLVDFDVMKYAMEVERRNDALMAGAVKGRIATKDELARTLEKVVGLSYRLLDAESVELALLDRDTGLYHSSFVLGKPFRKSAQMMLSEGSEGPGVLISPINFAGSVLGSLRAGLKKNAVPNAGDRQILELLALQSSMAVINAEFTGELLKMRRVSDESIKAKTGFLANLSHEIRGPLSIMMNAVELVLEELCGPVSQDQRETLNMVKTNGRHLLDLINDVLDYAKAESGRVTATPVALDADDLLADLRNVISAQAEAKSHKVRHKVSGSGMGMMCDRRHARQILINLLTNAVKYTPEAGLIELWAERSAGNRIKINVKDSGVGISPHDRDKVFAAFERIDHEYSSRQGGTGLGLSLTRKLVEINGGTIDFISSPGTGSHFFLLMPAADIVKDTEVMKKDDCVSGKGRTVLLMGEDNQERKSIGRYLAKLRFALAYAASAREAVTALGSARLRKGRSDSL